MTKIVKFFSSIVLSRTIMRIFHNGRFPIHGRMFVFPQYLREYKGSRTFLRRKYQLLPIFKHLSDIPVCYEDFESAGDRQGFHSPPLGTIM